MDLCALNDNVEGECRVQSIAMLFRRESNVVIVCTLKMHQSSSRASSSLRAWPRQFGTFRDDLCVCLSIRNAVE